MLLAKDYNIAIKLLFNTKLMKNMLADFPVKKRISFIRFKETDAIDKRWAILLKHILYTRELSKKLIKDISLHLKWSKKRRKDVIFTLGLNLRNKKVTIKT